MLGLRGPARRGDAQQREAEHGSDRGRHARKLRHHAEQREADHHDADDGVREGDVERALLRRRAVHQICLFAQAALPPAPHSHEDDGGVGRLARGVDEQQRGGEHRGQSPMPPAAVITARSEHRSVTRPQSGLLTTAAVPDATRNAPNPDASMPASRAAST